MGHDFKYADLIILALVAGFLILRLRAALGKRPENDQAGGVDRGVDRPANDVSGPAAAPSGTVINFPNTAVARDSRPLAAAEADGPLAAIVRVDPSFDGQHFVAGARKAFEMILEAFSRGDLPALRPLLGDAVFANFAAAVQERQRLGHRMEAEIERFQSITLVSSAVNATLAFVTVRFISDQVVVMRDAAGHIIEGQPGRSHRITDDWTFARPVRSVDPNWQLVETAEAR